MKKLFLTLATVAMTLVASAANLNNPVGADGRYIVKYDCANHTFAAANDFEVDETVTIAFDVTGTWLADWLKATPAAEGASRGVAFNNWTNYGDTNSDFRRLKLIDGNIWGVTMKLSDLMINTVEAPKALMTDSVVYMYAQFFGFEYTAENPGAGWWMWDGHPEAEATQAEGADCLFATLAYTGTKTSDSFYGDDFTEGIYGFGLQGYAAPCVEVTSAITNTAAQKNTSKVIENGQLILIHNGVRYNVLGTEVK